VVHISIPVPTMADADNDALSPPIRRIAGPLDGYRLGVTDVPVRIYDLTLDGCFVELSFGSLIVKNIRLQIDLPGEGWTVIQCDMHHIAGYNTFAVTFTRLDDVTRSRIARAIDCLGDRPPGDDASVINGEANDD
jgi:hypothetical protein